MKNKIIGDINFNNASVEFKGENNILYCNGNITLENCKIRFTGSNSLIYLDKNKYPFSINIRVGNDSVFYLGKRCYLNRTSNIYATERKNIIIGNECLLSFGCYFRTADPHIIYDTNTKKRINFSKSILIGDHVWVGQNCLILKNTKIGSGAIIGGNSVVSNKVINSNSIFGGNPAKKIRENVFYSSPMSTHDYDEGMEIESENFDNDDYVYNKDNNTLDMNKIDNDLQRLKTSEEKLKYININISKSNNKNRFYI